MIERIKRNLKWHGFHFELGIEDADLLKIASKLGTPKGEARSPGLVRTISPQSIDVAKPNTLSSRFGTSAFPYHTDAAYWELPARFILLYCLNPGSGQRPTLLIDSWTWKLTSTQRNNLHDEVWQTINGRPFLCTLMETVPSGSLLRFDESCLRPITKGAFFGHQSVLSSLERSDETRIDWLQGAMLIIDNYRLLHARGTAIRDDSDRALRKILVAG